MCVLVLCTIHSPAHIYMNSMAHIEHIAQLLFVLLLLRVSMMCFRKITPNDDDVLSTEIRSLSSVSSTEWKTIGCSTCVWERQRETFHILECFIIIDSMIGGGKRKKQILTKTSPTKCSLRWWFLQLKVQEWVL